MTINPFGLANFRFLDSLDSIRFRPHFDFADIRQLHARADVILSLMFGDGVVISENQLVDSLGFISLFPELVKLGIAHNVDIPIRVALRDPALGIYRSAAAMFGNIDQDDPRKRFQLSLFRELDESYKRRKIWADCISRGELPPQGDVREDEQNTILGLMDVLKQLTSPSLAEFSVAKSENMPFILADNITQISELATKADEFERLFVEQVDPRYPQIVQPEWLAESQHSLAREIVAAVHEFEIKYGRISRRSLIHNNIDDVERTELQQGILEVADSLYNFNLAVSTHSDILSDTAARDLANPYVVTARALTNWAKETSAIPVGLSPKISTVNPEGWITTSDFIWLVSLHDQEKRRILDEMPLEACVSMLAEPEWKNSMAEYKYELANLRNIDIIMNGVDDLGMGWQQFRDDAKKRLEEARHQHIAACAKYMANSDKWRLSPEGRIDYSSAAKHGEKGEVELSFEIKPVTFKLKADLAALRKIQRAIQSPLAGPHIDSQKLKIQGLVTDLADTYNPIQ